MKIHKGTDRIVFVGEHRAIKVARIQPILAFSLFKELSEDFGLSVAWSRRKTGGKNSVEGFLTAGIKANKTEARLARLHPEVVHVTKRLLGGLVNVQDTALPINHDRASIVTAFEEQIGDQKNAIGHILSDSRNFGRNKNGMPRILDAGSKQLEQLLENEAMNVATQETLSGLR